MAGANFHLVYFQITRCTARIPAVQKLPYTISVYGIPGADCTTKVSNAECIAPGIRNYTVLSAKLHSGCTSEDHAITSAKLLKYHTNTIVKEQI